MPDRPGSEATATPEARRELLRRLLEARQSEARQSEARQSEASQSEASRSEALSSDSRQPDTHLPSSGRQIVSSQQERLWVAHQLDPEDPSQNLRSALRIRGPLDSRALERSLDALLARHEQLRATFHETGGRLAARIDGEATLGVRRIDLRGSAAPDLGAETAAVVLEQASLPFDLTEGPPVRAALLTLAEDEFILVLTVHHIVCDAWSMDLLLRELRQLYEAETSGRRPALASLSDSYSSFARAQLETLAGPAGSEQEAFWRRQLSGFRAPSLQPLLSGGAGGTQMPSRRLPFGFSAPLGREVDRLARAHGATAFIVLLTAFAALLHRITGAPDVVVASPVANRQDEAWEGLVGYFVNLLPLRVPVESGARFTQLLRGVRRTVLEAQDHQLLPVHKIAEAALLRPSSLLRVLFQHVAAPTSRFEIGGLALEPRPIDLGRTRHDLSLTTYAESDRLAGILEHSTDLLDTSTAERLVADLESILVTVVEDPAVGLSELPISPDWLPVPQELGAGGTPAEESKPCDAGAIPAPPSATEPRSTEDTLAAIWRDTLQLDTVSPFDNFLDVGGDSLLAMQVIERAERELGTRLAPADLFTQTLAQLAASCEKRRA